MSDDKNTLSAEIENNIISIWRRVLNNQNVSPLENFFDAGGNSLLMSKVYREIKNKMDVPVSIVDLFQYPTVRMLSQRIRDVHAGRTGSKA
ncbi:phosphopantetheine-binding protein [Brenneria salicis]|uniref:Phosphopantetheine binding protein n=1 Tax=Brenneria salicis ATCC 15712 = DSM 30166 TaxID=714314 RepID=A0A366I648_9GAMM|nr:phosphopantetheine-binding protein [Brenneria salicis]RBP63787.1 phosphopantetheine binding protein [Brenneria salicis ATCC 15712 = DSM 30166]RLM31068.1 thioester reductase [Brenneria salicis ATCC 15712 = DSM 30166]